MLVALVVSVVLELRSVLRQAVPEYKSGCIEPLTVLVREPAVALVELFAFESLAPRAVPAAVAGGAGRFAAGKQSVAELAELRLTVLAVLALVVLTVALVLAYFRLVEAERKLSVCIELLAVLKLQLVGAPVESELAVQAAVALVV